MSEDEYVVPIRPKRRIRKLTPTPMNRNLYSAKLRGLPLDENEDPLRTYHQKNEDRSPRKHFILDKPPKEASEDP